MSDQTVYRVTFPDGSSCHYGVESLARAAARGTGRVEAITVQAGYASSPAQLAWSAPAIDIDSQFAPRLALLLECLMIDYHGTWNDAAALLDEYKAAWDAVNPQPPTFMGEPMPPERKARLLGMKAAHADSATERKS